MLKVGKKISLISFLVFLISFSLALYILFSPSPFGGNFLADIEKARIILLVISSLSAASFFVWIFSLKNNLAKKAGKVLLPLLLILVFLYIFTIRLNKVNGGDMEPLFPHQSYILSDLISYRLGPPKRGDVVIFTSPSDELTRVGRIVGLPGEDISIQSGKVYINNNLLPEPYVYLETYVELQPFPDKVNF
jgi:signal peptidase I